MFSVNWVFGTVSTALGSLGSPSTVHRGGMSWSTTHSLLEERRQSVYGTLRGHDGQRTMAESGLDARVIHLLFPEGHAGIVKDLSESGPRLNVSSRGRWYLSPSLHGGLGLQADKQLFWKWTLKQFFTLLHHSRLKPVTHHMLDDPHQTFFPLHSIQ